MADLHNPVPTTWLYCFLFHLSALTSSSCKLTDSWQFSGVSIILGLPQTQDVYICLVSKILPSLPVLSVLFFHHDYVSCEDQYILFFTRTSNVILFSCPQIIATGVVIINSCYLGYTIMPQKFLPGWLKHKKNPTGTKIAM